MTGKDKFVKKRSKTAVFVKTYEFSKEILKPCVIPTGRKFAVESTETLSFVKAFENWVFYKNNRKLVL